MTCRYCNDTGFELKRGNMKSVRFAKTYPDVEYVVRCRSYIEYFLELKQVTDDPASQPVVSGEYVCGGATTRHAEMRRKRENKPKGGKRTGWQQ